VCLSSLAFPGSCLQLDNPLGEIHPTVDGNGEATKEAAHFILLKSSTGAVALESLAHPGFFVGVSAPGQVFAASGRLGEEPARFQLRSANMSSDACVRIAGVVSASTGREHHPTGRGSGMGGGASIGQPRGLLGFMIAGLGSMLGGHPSRSGAQRNAVGAVARGPLPIPPPDPRSHPALRHSLSEVNVAALVHDGYCVFPGIVPRKLVWAALRQINSGLGAGLAASALAGSASRSGTGVSALHGSAADTDPQGVDTGLSGAAAAAAQLHPRASQLLGRLATKAGVQLSQAPEVLALLFGSPAWGAVHSIIGQGKCLPPRAAQVALRFPEHPGSEGVDMTGSADRAGT